MIPGPFCDALMRWMPSSAAFPKMAHHLLSWVTSTSSQRRLQSNDLITNCFTTFDLTLSPSPPTHRAGNQLNLVLTRSCCTLALSVTPLPVSDHHFVAFSLPRGSPPRKPPFDPAILPLILLGLTLSDFVQTSTIFSPSFLAVRIWKVEEIRLFGGPLLLPSPPLRFCLYSVSSQILLFCRTKRNSSASDPRKLLSMFSSRPHLALLTADVSHFTKKVKATSSSFSTTTMLPTTTPTSVRLTHLTPHSPAGCVQTSNVSRCHYLPP